MSGIYGFTYRTATDQELVDALGAMEYWNRSYGSEAIGHQKHEKSALGCHVEHFTGAFPFSEPVLSFHDGYAVVDALLYNRDELLAMLIGEDDSISDEALVLRLIDVKGFDSLAYINGDYAGAIYDPKSMEWILFRDHLGVRPLHYYLDHNLLAFSTDLRALVALPQANAKPNEELLYARLSGGLSISLQETEFANIRCVHPASVTRIKMTARDYSVTEHTYWRLGQKKVRYQKDEDYRQELYRLVTDSVNRRCDAISGVLGAELSGGLDSTVIDILINRHGRKAKFYSWSYDPDLLPITADNDERKLVLDVCDQEGITCRFRRSSDLQLNHLPSNTLMPPMTNTQTISYGSAWLKSQGARVVFSGHGGDEGISHRASRYELFYNREYLPYFKLFWLDAKGKRFRLLRALKWSVTHAAERSPLKKHDNDDLSFYERLMCPDFADRLRSTRKQQSLNFNYAPLSHIMRGGLRPRLDTCAFQGALNGVRYIFPFLDYRVVDYALSIPRRFYINKNGNRVIYREAFQHLLPPSMHGEIRKATVSTQALANQDDDIERFFQMKGRLLDRLDRTYWQDILNFVEIEALCPAQEQCDHMNQMLDRIVTCLWQCVTIQKFQKTAQKWREFDEQDKTV